MFNNKIMAFFFNRKNLRYTPSDGVVMNLDVSEISGTIQEQITGTVEDVQSGEFVSNIQDVSIDEDFEGEIK